MPTNKQRRETQRRHLERQLERRREREIRRRKATLITSIVGTLVLIGAVILTFTLLGSGDDKKTNSAAGPGSGSSSPTTPTRPATPTSSAPSPTPSKSYPPATGASLTFAGVTVKGTTDLKGYPVVTSKSSTNPKKLEYSDLVVGKGKAATPASTVTVQYTGVLYKDGTKFDSSWDRGQPAQFSLTQVVKGFTQGIGGTSGIPAMHAGGRRIMILPASLGYGAQAQGNIPANSPLVFVVDLISVDS